MAEENERNGTMKGDAGMTRQTAGAAACALALMAGSASLGIYA